jgi:hypothetical protein
MPKNPNRKYDRQGRRIKQTPTRPVTCLVWDNVHGQRFQYDPVAKRPVMNAKTHTVFLSKTQARKAAWHITRFLQEINWHEQDFYVEVVPL